MQTVSRFPNAIVAAAGVPGRAGSTLCQTGDTFILFGGADRTGEHFADAFTVSALTGELTHVESQGVAPPKCGGHAAFSCTIPVAGAEGAHRPALVVFGGIDFVEEEVYNSVFEGVVDHTAVAGVHGISWRKPAVGGTAPEPRTGHTLTPLPARAAPATALLFGGSSPYSGPMNDAHLLRISCPAPATAPAEYEWVPVDTRGDPPEPREMHAAFALPGGALVVVVGGRGLSGTPLRTLHVLSLDEGGGGALSPTWHAALPTPYAIVSAAAAASHGGAVQHFYGGWAGDAELQAGVITLDTRSGGGSVGSSAGDAAAAAAKWTWTRALLDPPRAPRFAACAALARLVASEAAAASEATAGGALSPALAAVAGMERAALVPVCDAGPWDEASSAGSGVPLLLVFGGMTAGSDLAEVLALRLTVPLAPGQLLDGSG